MALRVIATAGYMPMVERGHLMLMLCPDGEWTAPVAAMPGMDHHGSKTPDHQQCPYAAAAATPLASGHPPALRLLTPQRFVKLTALALPSLSTSARRQRPPPTGPPLRLV